MKHQKRATYYLYHTIKLEWLDTLDHVIFSRYIPHPRNVLRSDGKRWRVFSRQPLESVPPDFLIVPLSPPGEAASVALLERCRAWRVIATKADRHNTNALRIDFGSGCKIFPNWRCIVFCVVT